MSIRNRPNSRPTLVMMPNADEDSTSAQDESEIGFGGSESVAISSWNKDAIIDYLESHLKRNSASSASKNSDSNVDEVHDGDEL